MPVVVNTITCLLRKLELPWRLSYLTQGPQPQAQTDMQLPVKSFSLSVSIAYFAPY
jgi:hypothetical protein